MGKRKTKRRKKSKKVNKEEFRKDFLKAIEEVTSINKLYKLNYTNIDEKKNQKIIIYKTQNIISNKEFSKEKRYKKYKKRYGNYCIYKSLKVKKLENSKKKWKFEFRNYNSNYVLKTCKGTKALRKYFLEDVYSVIPGDKTKLSYQYTKALESVIYSLKKPKMVDLYIKYKSLHQIDHLLKTKDDYKYWIFEALFSLVSTHKKRKLEKEYINESGYLFLKFIDSKFILPEEIISIILSYLKKDIDYLNNIGCVNTVWYLSCLKNWDLMKIRDKYLEKLPILALRHAKTLSIYNTKHNWNKSKQTHLFNNLFNVNKLILTGTGVFNILQMFSMNDNINSNIRVISMNYNMWKKERNYVYNRRLLLDKSTLGIEHAEIIKLLRQFKSLVELNCDFFADWKDYWNILSKINPNPINPWAEGKTGKEKGELFIKPLNIKKIGMHLNYIAYYEKGDCDFKYLNDSMAFLPSNLERMDFYTKNNFYLLIGDKLNRFTNLKILNIYIIVKSLDLNSFSNLEELTLTVENLYNKCNSINMKNLKNLKKFNLLYKCSLDLYNLHYLKDISFLSTKVKIKVILFLSNLYEQEKIFRKFNKKISKDLNGFEYVKIVSAPRNVSIFNYFNKDF